MTECALLRTSKSVHRFEVLWAMAKPLRHSGFGALTYTTSPLTGLLGVGLGGDSSPRMIAFQARVEF